MCNENRRRLRRHILSYNLPVYNTSTGKRIGFLNDITPEGFLLVGEQSFGANEPVHIRIETGAPGNESITVDAICRWCAKDARQTLWKAGFLITGENERQAEQIVRLICRTGV